MPWRCAAVVAGPPMARSGLRRRAGRVAIMLQDLAALAAPLIVCVAFLVGVGVLLRREMAPRRRSSRAAEREGARPDGGGPGGRSGLVAAEGEVGRRELGETSGY